MTCYFLSMAAWLVLSALLLWFRTRDLRLTLTCAVSWIMLGFIMAKLLYALPMLSVLLTRHGIAGLFRLNAEEFSVWGGAAGVCLGTALSAKLSRKSPAAVLDAFAPSGALLLAGTRCSELFLTPAYLHHGMIGLGDEMPDGSWFCRFPFAVMDEWEMWYSAIFMLEAVIALVGVVLALTYFRRKYCFSRTLFFLIAAQLLTEMFHNQTIAWGFVRVEQLYCAAAVLVILWTLCRRADQPRKYMPVVGACLLIGVIVLLEFELDKSWLSGWLWQIGSEWAISLAAWDAALCYVVFLVVVLLLLLLCKSAVRSARENADPA